MVGHIVVAMLAATLVILMGRDLWRSHFKMKFDLNPESVRISHKLSEPVECAKVRDVEGKVNDRIERLKEIKKETDRRHRTPSRVIPPPPPGVVLAAKMDFEAAEKAIAARDPSDPASDTKIMAIDAKLKEIERIQAKKS